MSSYNGTISAEDTLCGSIAAVYGKDGASAYELAVKNGFTGTEAEWLASLKGADGEKGEKGDAGPQGEKGDTGDAGADGHSPVITAVKSGKVTTIQADGTAIAEIHDGEDGESAGNAVLYTGQTLTEAQKAQARANIGAGTVNDADLTELSDAFAADLAEKQDVLTAGDNITISADGTISAAGGSGGTTPKVEKTSSDTASELASNTFYVFPEMASLEIALVTPSNTDIVSEYKFRFTSGASATTLTLPSGVIGDITIEANKVYEISIIDNYLAYQSWAVSA